MTRKLRGKYLVRALIFVALAAVSAFAFLGAAESGAVKKQPGWVETGHSLVPLEYFQGVTSDPQKDLFFDGVFSGLYRTDANLNEQARNVNVIPADVNQR